MNIIYVLLICMLLFIGCATNVQQASRANPNTPSSYTAYTTPDMPVTRAFYDCQTKAQMVFAQYQAADRSYTGLQGNIYGSYYANIAMQNCMASHGYRR